MSRKAAASAIARRQVDGKAETAQLDRNQQVPQFGLVFDCK